MCYEVRGCFQGLSQQGINLYEENRGFVLCLPNAESGPDDRAHRWKFP
jgi:hypothetical protein